MKINIILIIFVLILNCHHSRIRFDSGASESAIGTNTQIIEKSVWYWAMFTKPKFWAADSRIEKIDLNSICSTGVNEVDQFLNWKQVIYSQLTLGVYIPYSLKVSCN